MKITNTNYTRDAITLAQLQIMQLLTYGTSQPSRLTQRSPKLSMEVSTACQQQAQQVFADLFSMDLAKITFMERVFPGSTERVQDLGLPRDPLPWIRIHEYDMEKGFRVWDWHVAMADPQLISQTPVAKYNFEE
jgi:hypothetical protein